MLQFLKGKLVDCLLQCCNVLVLILLLSDLTLIWFHEFKSSQLIATGFSPVFALIRLSPLIVFHFLFFGRRYHCILPHYFRVKLMGKELIWWCIIRLMKVLPRNFHQVFKKVSGWDIILIAFILTSLLDFYHLLTLFLPECMQIQYIIISYAVGTV